MDFNIDEMRQQMAILQNKLDNQTIVNDRVLRRAVKRGASVINQRYLIIGIVALLMIPYGYWAFVMLAKMSTAFWIASCVMMLAVVGFMIYNSREMRRSDFATDNLLDTKRKVAAAKKNDAMWPVFSVPLVLAWAGWGGKELSRTFTEMEFFIPCYIVVVVLGVVTGLCIHFRTQRQYRAIIEQIEDMEETE